MLFSVLASPAGVGETLKPSSTVHLCSLTFAKMDWGSELFSWLQRQGGHTILSIQGRRPHPVWEPCGGPHHLLYAILEDPEAPYSSQQPSFHLVWSTSVNSVPFPVWDHHAEGPGEAELFPAGKPSLGSEVRP